MGMSDPEARKKLSEARWLQFKHQSEKQGWPWWKRLIHRFQTCPMCKPEKLEPVRGRERSGSPQAKS